MSSWFRNKYPHIAMGALASSAVIEAVYDFYQFDEQVYNATKKSGDQCPQRLLQLIDYIDSNFKKGNKTAIKNIFGDKALNMADFDFHFFIADVIVESVQYGDREEFCNEAVKYTSNDDILAWFGKWAPEHRANPEFYDSTILKKTEINFDFNMRQWTYQYCS